MHEKGWTGISFLHSQYKNEDTSNEAGSRRVHRKYTHAILCLKMSG